MVSLIKESAERVNTVPKNVGARLPNVEKRIRAS